MDEWVNWENSHSGPHCLESGDTSGADISSPRHWASLLALTPVS